MKYTVDDLNRMRKALEALLAPWRYWKSENGTLSGPEGPVSHEEIERQLVTYMMNQTTPEELEEAARAMNTKAMADAR